MCLSVTGREQGGNILFYLLGVAEYLSGSSGHAVQRARNHCAGKRSDTDGACLLYTSIPSKRDTVSIPLLGPLRLLRVITKLS